MGQDFQSSSNPTEKSKQGARCSEELSMQNTGSFFHRAETHSWQHTLVRGIWKPSPSCHPAKFKIDLPLKFLDAFTEYKIQAEVSRRPGCFL